MATPASAVAPIIVRKIRKGGHAGHHGGAWKVAYADFVTAMMAFFMLLWLLSSPDKEKLKGLAQYFSPAPPTPSQMTSSPGETAGVGGRTRRAQAESMRASGQPAAEAATAGAARGGTALVPDAAMRVMAEELRIAIDSASETKEAKQNVRIEPIRDGIRISLMDSHKRAMFQGSTAVPNAYARGLLRTIAQRVRKSGSRIAIEGHTDSVGGQNDANWRLSGDRAQAARSTLVDAGLTPDRISEVAALAGAHPLYPDQPDRPENRRITIVILAEPSALPSDVSFRF